MLKINYKGYEISQAENNHIMICKNKETPRYIFIISKWC